MRIMTIALSGLMILALVGCTVQSGDAPEPAQSDEVQSVAGPGQAALEQRLADVEARLNKMEMLLIDLERDMADIGLQASQALNEATGKRHSLFDLSGDENFEEKVLRQGMVLLRDLLDEMEEKALEDLHGGEATDTEPGMEPTPVPAPETTQP